MGGQDVAVSMLPSEGLPLVAGRVSDNNNIGILSDQQHVSGLCGGRGDHGLVQCGDLRELCDQQEHDRGHQAASVSAA